MPAVDVGWRIVSAHVGSQSAAQPSSSWSDPAIVTTLVLSGWGPGEPPPPPPACTAEGTATAATSAAAHQNAAAVGRIRRRTIMDPPGRNPGSLVPTVAELLARSAGDTRSC